VKRYGRIVAVDHVDLNVERGDVFGYLGPNGAGKTTSLRMLLGLIRPTAGTALLFGRDPLIEGARALDGVSGFVEGPRFYPYLSGRRNLSLLADYDQPSSHALIDEVLELVELRERAADRVGGYSHGMRQRLGIAASLLRRPRLLLLDELTTGLDPAGMRDMRDLRRLRGRDHDRARATCWPRSRSSATASRSSARAPWIYQGELRPARDRHRRHLPRVDPERARRAARPARCVERRA
jgi:ABC-2 type transport system ATP-binding protein